MVVWRRMLMRMVAGGLGLAIACALTEVALHAAPRLLPLQFREAYPVHGVEFFEPGVLDRTPVGQMPLPLRGDAYAGPRPTDLVDIGVAPESEREAARLQPSIRIPIDARGFANPTALERADVLLLGDSFVYGMAANGGEDLGLDRELGQSIYNLGIPGAGPHQEAHVLEALGPELRPKVVVWCVFGGNDLQDSARIEAAIAAGAKTTADRSDLPRAPRFILPALLQWFAGSVEFGTPAYAGTRPAPLAGAVCSAPQREPHRYWFHPENTRLLLESKADLQQGPGFAGWSQCAARIASATAAVGARLLVVYLPSKSAAMLPFVGDGEFGNLIAAAAFGAELPAPEQWPALRARAERNAGAFAELVADRCRELGVAMIDTTPALRASFAAGANPYLDADTHLSEAGNRALRAPIAAGCRELLAR